VYAADIMGGLDGSNDERDDHQNGSLHGAPAGQYSWDFRHGQIASSPDYEEAYRDIAAAEARTMPGSAGEDEYRDDRSSIMYEGEYSIQIPHSAIH